MAEYSLLSPAKVNLTLDVLHRRPDGYHAIESIMQMVELHDRIHLQTTQETWQVQCNDPRVPLNGKNLALQAAKRMYSHFDLKGGLHIQLEKNIPVAAGLGGGSSNAAAVIRGIMAMFSLEKYQEEIHAIAGELGSDVPFFLQGGTALVTGRGEHVSPLADLPRRPLILASFTYGLSTAEIYRRWQGKGSHRTRQALPAVEAGSWEGVLPHVGNDLEEVALAMEPLLKTTIEHYRNISSGPVLVSGSGPTLILFGELEGDGPSVPQWAQPRLLRTRTQGKEFMG